MSKKDYGINYFEDGGVSPYTNTTKVKIYLWLWVWTLCIRWLPKKFFNPWIRFWYSIFGTEIPSVSYIHPTAYVYMPWNLKLGPYSTIGGHTDIYNAAPIVLGRNCVVSERAYLCTASHNISSKKHEQVEKPITLCDRSWVASEAFVGMGVTIGEGAVVGARAAVFKDVEPWTVVGGNPARFIKKRVIVN